MVYDISAVLFLFSYYFSFSYVCYPPGEVFTLSWTNDSDGWKELERQSRSLFIYFLVRVKNKHLKRDAPFDPLLEIHLHQLYPMNCVWNPQVPVPSRCEIVQLKWEEWKVWMMRHVSVFNRRWVGCDSSTPRDLIHRVSDAVWTSASLTNHVVFDGGCSNTTQTEFWHL